MISIFKMKLNQTITCRADFFVVVGDAYPQVGTLIRLLYVCTLENRIESLADKHYRAIYLKNMITRARDDYTG